MTWALLVYSPLSPSVICSPPNISGLTPTTSDAGGKRMTCLDNDALLRARRSGAISGSCFRPSQLERSNDNEGDQREDEKDEQ